jgi:predicted TIM-barrel fold metal-dependent hydrolase
VGSAQGCRVKIIDAHHHLWNLKANHYPWLLDPKTPRLYGDHSSICHDYRVTDYHNDIAGLDIVKSVHVQADSDFADPVRETRWLQSVADNHTLSGGFPHAIVAYADLATETAEAVLAEHCRFPNMRGIRQPLNGIVTNPARHPDILNDDRWRANIGLLAKYNLSFDLQLFPSQMPSAATLIAQHPRVQFVVLHQGLPLDQSPDGLARWREGLALLARYPNVAVKISGFGMFDHAWTTDSIRPLVLTTLDIFGPERAMFGSNFPVDGIWSSAARVWSAYRTITDAFSETETTMMFHDNAAKFYRLAKD